MPIKACTEDGKQGWKYGDAGTCYTHDGSEAGSAAAKRQAVKQALAIGGGKPPSDLSDAEIDAFADHELDAIVDYADGQDPPAGVVRCTMSGTAGFRGDGGPTSACHVHDGTPASMRSAIAKALRDRGTTNPPPNANSDRDLAELETVVLQGVPLMAIGGPYFGSGSPEAGDFFESSHLQEIVKQTQAVADEVKIPIKLGHNRSQKLLKNSGLFTDEQPAAGWVDPGTMRVSGGQLLADIKGVPKKLADLVKTGAFRTRSVELSRVKSQRQGGKVYDSVITGLALLGAKAPAIRTLDDIVALYADAEPESRFADGTEATPVHYFTVHHTEIREGDTSVMTETATAPAEQKLTDEQIEALAATFGISEDDPAKRREAVLAKFTEHAPASETTEPPAPTTPPTPPAPPAPADPPASHSLSDDEIKELREKADQGAKAFSDAKSGRIKATVALAAKQGRIKTADAPEWIEFAERDEDFAVKQLLKLPVNLTTVTTFGSDGEGEKDTVSEAEDKLYAAFAGQTGVRRVISSAGGNA